MALGTLLDRGHALMERLLGSAGGIAVRYVHYKKDAVTGDYKVVGSVDITAESGDCIEGRTVYSSNRQDAARIQFGELDFIIKASALMFEPREGDRIVDLFKQDEDGNWLPQRTYEVMQPNSTDPALRWSDPQRTRYRIHVKLVKQEK